MSLQAAWSNYSGSCKCDKSYDNNCAHFLSDALIKGGFSDIDGGSGGNFRLVNGFCVCRSGRPVRAKELRDWFGKKWSQHSTPPQNGIIAVYQERPADLQGHVLLKRYEDGEFTTEYQGTGDFGEESDWTEEYYY